jgi:hypothetical protein
MDEKKQDALRTITFIKTQLLNELGVVDDELICKHINEYISKKIKDIIDGQIFLCSLSKLTLMEQMLNGRTEEGTSGLRQEDNKRKSAKKAVSS